MFCGEGARKYKTHLWNCGIGGLVVVAGGGGYENPMLHTHDKTNNVLTKNS